MTFNKSMPESAKQAFTQARRLRGSLPLAGARKHAMQPRLTAGDRAAFPADERKHRLRDREEARAVDAQEFLATRKFPRRTALALKLAHVRAVAEMTRIKIARSPERVRASQQRHVNTVCHSILRERGLR